MHWHGCSCSDLLLQVRISVCACCRADRALAVPAECTLHHSSAAFPSASWLHIACTPHPLAHQCRALHRDKLDAGGPARRAFIRGVWWCCAGVLCRARRSRCGARARLGLAAAARALRRARPGCMCAVCSSWLLYVVLAMRSCRFVAGRAPGGAALTTEELPMACRVLV